MSKIFGIGNDIVKISRLQSSFERHGEKFLKRAFSDKEIQTFQSLSTEDNSRKWEYLAGRWSAKESIYKAIGDQERSKLNFQNIEIFNEPNGKPYVHLLEPTKSYFKNLGIDKIHIAISHDTDYAIANVMLESFNNSNNNSNGDNK
ncbi:hypothetical protein DICPUDRAFT_74089 [Dictyostelium purpureum]|uniref:4'-phosphopantetheinyl transferase domain-containing protein n=1 Tax=Dictyostelium purpureum TaxID=5786 RepID=F0Z6W1_DICPU|nr:uncharacterized protein DICPUDRAFT_74089 [Dictyostelium purpureum]EGC40378.1 hypothetical protein DICPUDRAFT_74089 [Dictyostelium purpureum]|eukprot:XP_003283129.1 hypothetical protein DICPUDRAFT_74089 [Dictyostelium purpureum]